MLRWTALAVPLLLSGCVGTNTASISVDRDGSPTDATASTSCPDTAVLDLSVTVRDGGVRVRVLDGDGAVVFNETYEASDGGETSRSLLGAAGTWTLAADSPSFDGRLRATLSCG